MRALRLFGPPMFAVLVFLFAVHIPTQAQTNSSSSAHVSGTITDASGAGVGGVQVIAQLDRDPHAPAQSTISAKDGEYSLTLSPAVYRIRFQRPEFAARDLLVDLAAGESRALSLRLELEPLSSHVVVTAEAEPVTASSTPAPVTTITADEIEQRQSVSLSDLLAQQPGISITRTGAEGGLATVFLDGGNSNFTKVLIDGTPANEPGGVIDLASLTLDNIDKVEIVHGAESALYGSDAVDGVIQLFTHRGTTRIPSFDLFAEGGGYSSARGGADISGLLGRFDYSAAASYFETDGQGLDDGFLNRTISANAGWRFSDTNQIRISVRNNTSNAELPGQTLFFPPAVGQSDLLHLLTANLSWNFKTGSHWQHRISGTESRTVDTNMDAPFSPYIDVFNRASLQAQSTYLFRQGGITAGYQYEVENGFPGALSGEHVGLHNQAGYLDARWQPLAELTFSAGVRAEANELFGTRVVPRAGVAYALRRGQGFWGDTRLRFSYGQGIKEPEFDQTFGSDPCFPGNPALRPESSKTYHGGVDQFLASDRIRASVDFFNDDFYDLIAFAPGQVTPSCPFGSGTSFNTDLARARGVNFATQVRVAHWLSIDGNYTLDDSRVVRAPNAPFPIEGPGNHLLRRPVNAGNLIFNAAYRRFQFNFVSVFSGRRTDSDFDGFGITYNPGYARFDVASSYEFPRGFSLYSRVTNLLDKHYQDAVGFPALGRDYRVGIRYRFGGR
jgi:vitamin B12 transporter